MNRAETLQKIAENELRVFSTGYKQGKQEGYEQGSMPIYYMNSMNNLFNNVEFPENTDLTFRLKKCGGFSYTFRAIKNVNTVKLIVEEPCQAAFTHGVRDTSIKVFDITECDFDTTDLSYSFYYSQKLKSILGELNVSSCKNDSCMTGAFSACLALEDITFVENTILVSINFDRSTKLTKESITSIINGLNNEATGKTLILAKTAKENAFTDEEWATLIATKPNWTISLSVW